jgi:purine-nucleoside phosphorylase
MIQLKEKLDAASLYVNKMIGEQKVDIGMILGSGLGVMAKELSDPITIEYKDIPHFPVSTVPGHAGTLVIGFLEGKRVMVMNGRFHFYEGHSMDTLVFPVQMMKKLGINNLVVTNAAGCVNTSWSQGNLMVIADHIKLVQDNPLRGENDDSLGDRFFDMSTAYSKELRELAHTCAGKIGVTLREGIYQFFSGPSFETPAEVRVARLLGADAVGMSTVPEVIAASHMKMRVLGISCLTNMAAGILSQPLNHEEVLETGKQVMSTFSALIREIVKEWKV